VLTPTPDPFNQSIMAVPMYAFYEMGIVGAKLFGKKRPAPEVASAASTAPAPAGNR
jgi:sec-independent protein translocase protein TatC